MQMPLCLGDPCPAHMLKVDGKKKKRTSRNPRANPSQSQSSSSSVHATYKYAIGRVQKRVWTTAVADPAGALQQRAFYVISLMYRGIGIYYIIMYLCYAVLCCKPDELRLMIETRAPDLFLREFFTRTTVPPKHTCSCIRRSAFIQTIYYYYAEKTV